MLGLLLPDRCALCGAVGAPLCPRCARALPTAPAVPPPPGLDGCRSLLAYRDPVPELVARAKYRGRRRVLPLLGLALAGLLADGLPGDGTADGIDLVTWAPTSGARRRHRGFDQAEVLARAVAARIGRPVARTLDRDPGPPQTGRDRAHRLAGPSFRPRRRLAGTVVVVDDVRTTGATLSAAAAALRAAGAGRVVGLTLAVRP